MLPIVYVDVEQASYRPIPGLKPEESDVSQAKYDETILRWRTAPPLLSGRLHESHNLMQR
jgi:hypothetical protein